MVFGWGKKKDSIVDDVIEPVATSSTEITLSYTHLTMPTTPYV